MTALRVVPAGAAEAGVLSALYEAGFGEAWVAQELARLLSSPGVFALIALDVADEPVGFALGRVAADEAEILSISLLPAQRRRGGGRLLLDALVARCAAAGAAALFLEVAVDNAAALALYRRAGFQEAGRRKGYYKVGDAAVDALVMRQELAPGNGA
ncbi:ribosomal-protein-alanine N-acetyltransferase [Inquilinus ginsengisoli]|uniref:Ribosomal-protein-alanine N-acetyltransferase n=1 Tax=Inquilinus ginsengisoli TaxID=363840 RepID=A0ABU1JUV6_9PROT|nr:ribosomal protein S18-alanine N-acetyltransferase [Inquilinus ginsengisoli]MDR6292402.1 ribosomal-protein-alanine N-acetyltransferase [Inquilinus ginsengisoli]